MKIKDNRKAPVLYFGLLPTNSLFYYGGHLYLKTVNTAEKAPNTFGQNVNCVNLTKSELQHVRGDTEIQSVEGHIVVE